ncbi:MAG TPA: patatin family protein [Ruminococcaceae bacterium]|jgi:predicted patatin/cPLA2 family phospholipase|nr:patatin family protein [Oscillospiraceae bacterium]HCA71740.1 patatin family protein [Oscillospiraceae bacterium]HCC01565.1 patatin family protein [Oscillospiraceae bacterium]HCM24772.1 patatin family protein [Oscillospiraceae bacterium]
MIGVVDVGGGLRGIYGAGVLDYCLDNGIQFHYCIGVSAGSANIAAYLAKQRGRNYRYYAEYSFRKEYMSTRNFFRKGSYIDLEYVYGTLAKADGEDPLNYTEIQKSSSQIRVVATNALTGKPLYFDNKAILQDDYHVLMASSCIPLVCRPFMVDGIPCYDGGLSDPVPIQKAFDDGCDKVVVILTKPQNLLRKAKNDAIPARLLRKTYPKAAHALKMRYKTYNDGVALAEKYAKEDKALIVAPDTCCGMNTLTKNKACMDRMYQKGLKDGVKILDFLAYTE